MVWLQRRYCKPTSAVMETFNWFFSDVTMFIGLTCHATRRWHQTHKKILYTWLLELNAKCEVVLEMYRSHWKVFDQSCLNKYIETWPHWTCVSRQRLYLHISIAPYRGSIQRFHTVHAHKYKARVLFRERFIIPYTGSTGIS